MQCLFSKLYLKYFKCLVFLSECIRNQLFSVQYESLCLQEYHKKKFSLLSSGDDRSQGEATLAYRGSLLKELVVLDSNSKKQILLWGSLGKLRYENKGMTEVQMRESTRRKSMKKGCKYSTG